MFAVTKSEMSVRSMLLSSETKPTTIKKLLFAFVTLTPCCCTICGRSGVASCSLFCTCTCAMSGSTSLSNVSVMPTPPFALLDEDIYKRPSRPFMFCSMICVTDSSTVCAEAPGYTALMLTDGGAIVG